MHVVEHKRFGPVSAFRLGFGLFGPPLMCVIFYQLGGLLIDTAQHRMRKAALALIAPLRIERIVLTHHHEDHSGNAAAIAATRRIPVHGHELTARRMLHGFRIRPYQHLTWGRAEPAAVMPFDSPLESGGFRLLPIHTPGHSDDHTVFLETNQGWLFSGDLYLGDRVKFFRSDECMADQIRSLRRVLTYDFEALFCAHRPVAKNGKARLQSKLGFLEELYGRVQSLKQRGESLSAIIRLLDTGQDRLVKFITLGDASFANMIRSAFREDGAAPGCCSDPGRSGG